jgi:arylsulfatase A-like enzyme
MGIGIGAVSCPSILKAAKKKQKPNLVYIFPDEMRGTAMGFLGREPVITPNLDSLAKDSLVLPQAVSKR